MTDQHHLTSNDSSERYYAEHYQSQIDTLIAENNRLREKLDEALEGAEEIAPGIVKTGPWSTHWFKGAQQLVSGVRAPASEPTREGEFPRTFQEKFRAWAKGRPLIQTNHAITLEQAADYIDKLEAMRGHETSLRISTVYRSCAKHIGIPWSLQIGVSDARIKEVCPICEPPSRPLEQQHPDYCHEHGGHLRDSPACELARDKARQHPLETKSRQAPIARVRVSNGVIFEGKLFSPGLPSGVHDLYCEPEAVAPMLRQSETSPRKCPKCERMVTEGCNYCACPYPLPENGSGVIE